MLCIKIKAMKTAPEVQKDANLEDLLLRHTKYYPTVEEALNDLYVPLDFAVTLRSIYSNKVMQISEEGVKYYTNIVEVPQYVHKGYDLIMYLASIGVMTNINYAKEFDEVMMKYSQYQCIGLYNPAPEVINPIIYSHIYIADEGVKEIENFFKAGRKFVDIREAKQNCAGCIPALMNTLIEAKEDKENAQHDNN
jgi:hypothetical protein